MQKEHMNTLMTLVDDIKDSIPEGKYLEMCNAMKKAFENKPTNTIRWKTRVLATHEQPVIYIGNKSSSISNKITVTAIKKKPCGYDGEVFNTSQHRIQFTHGSDVIHEMAMGGAFHEYLTGVFELVNATKVKYTSTVVSTTTDNTPIFEHTHHTFKMRDWVKKELKDKKEKKEIEKLLDVYCEEEDNECDEDFNCNYETYFRRSTASHISQDLCRLMDTPIIDIYN
jgi:hypothetical protein